VMPEINMQEWRDEEKIQVVVYQLLWPIQVLLLFYHLCLAGSLFVLFSLVVDLFLLVLVSLALSCATAADAAAADANRVSFFLGSFLLIDRPILLLLFIISIIITIRSNLI
jgi:hypothetical protein